MGQHALLSPSASHRWLHCTAAPRLEEQVADSGSSYAEEGTLAHAYCAKKLKAFLGLPTTGEDEEIAQLDGKYHTGEMDEHTDLYASVVLEKYNAALTVVKDAKLLVETRLDFTYYIPDSFGTADAIIIADGTMEVIDFKYGKGVRVDASENPQMMIYALGAYDLYSDEYNIERVRMTIIQPRIDNCTECEMSVASLIHWAHDTLIPKAAEAYKGGEQEPGTWCQFCKVKGNCRALANRCRAAVVDPKLLSAEELATDVLPLLPTIKTWLTGVEDYALQQALAGEALPGWKVVEGRSVRKIVDPEGAAAKLTEAGYNEADIWRPRELRTITDLEKLVGKKHFAAYCGDYIDKPKGKPTLAPESDKRKVLNSAEDDFAGIID